MGLKLFAIRHTYNAAHTRQLKRVFLLVFPLLLMLALPAAAQDTDELGIHLYDCAYDEASNTVQIRVDLMERDGTPLFVDGATVRNLELPEGTVNIQRVEQRQPVRIIAVVDTTRSYPVEAMRDVLQDKMAGFPVLDELALVTFDDEVSPLLGPPTIEKLAIIDQYRDRIVPGGDQQAGIAVLYDGLLVALRDGVDPASPMRQVVLVLTDSPHRNAASDTTQQDVIDRAQAVNAQIFIIAFKTVADSPDFDILGEIASATNGFLWSYGQEEGEDKTPATLSQRMDDFLDMFQQALNAEYLITINADALEPDPDTLAVPMEVVVTSASREINLGTFNCIVPLVDHSVVFNNVTDNLFVPAGQPLVVETTIDSPFGEDEREARLFLNGNTRIFGNTIDLADATVRGALLPTNNTLRIELYDVRGGEAKLLAVDEVTGINFQRRLNLSVDGAPASLSGPVNFVAVPDGDFAIPPNPVVRFSIRAGEGDYQRLGLVDLIDGQARLTIPDINAQVAQLFPDGFENLQVIAYIDGTAQDGSDALFVSEPLTIGLVAAATVTSQAQVEASPTPAGEIVTPTTPVSAPVPVNTGLIIPLVTAGVLVLVDLILLRQIRVARVKRMINFPDNRELPQNLLRVTVSRAGRHQTYTLTKQTMEVGRGTSNDINLSEDTNISREHGVIMWRRGKWYYTNRKGQAKATVGLKTLRGFRLHPLGDNTQMQISDYTLMFHYDSDADPDSLMKTQF